MNEEMKIEEALRDLCTINIAEYGDGGKKVFYDLDGDKILSTAAAQTIITAAELIERWRADRECTEAYPESTVKELQATNQKLGVDLLKAQMKIMELQKDLESEAEKQTRLDIMSKRIDKLESERDVYKHCYEFLAVQHGQTN